MRLPTLECPHCGKELVYRAFEHIEQCAINRQREIDKEFASKNSQQFEDFMERAYKVHFVDVTPEDK
jgi:hypothetical protein